jgi:protein O-mannosyl-transferase
MKRSHLVPASRRPLASASGSSTAFTEQTAHTPWALLILLGLAVTVAVLTAHWPCLSARGLSFDDNQYLTHNILVQNPSLQTAWRFLREVRAPSTVGGYYQPLTMISLMVDYAFGGRPDNLTPFHVTSLALHAADALLILMLFWLLFRSVWAAAAAAILFGLHPMTVEPVAWVGERKTLLAAFFSLVGLVTYVLYARRGRRGWLLGCVAAYVLALLSKPTSTPLPVLLLLLDYWPLGRLSRRSVLEKLPLFAIGGVAAVVTVISQASAGIVSPGQRGPVNILLILCHNIVFYLAKIVWPVHLTSFYPFPQPFSLAHPMVLAGVVGTAVLMAILLIAWRKTPAPVTGWLLFFVAIFPTMGVIGFTNVIASDKYAYLPMVGLLLPLAYLFSRRLKSPSKHSRLALVAMLVGVLMLATAEGVTTRKQLQHWRDTETLWQYMLSLQPDAWPLHENLSIELLAKGDAKGAALHAREGIRLNPAYAEGYLDLGNALYQLGDLAESLRQYRYALTIEPRAAAAYYNIANVLQVQGKGDEAMENWKKALQIKPEYPDVHSNIAVGLLDKGDMAGALEHCRAAIRIQPNHTRARYCLGMILYTTGKRADAVDEWKTLLRLDPKSADTCNSLGGAMLEAGKVGEAIAYYREALRLQPDHELARINLARALGQPAQTAPATQSAPSATRPGVPATRSARAER